MTFGAMNINIPAMGNKCYEIQVDKKASLEGNHPSMSVVRWDNKYCI